MIKTKKLKNGLVEVTSDSGLVTIGENNVKSIICDPAEVEYVHEVKDGEKEE